MRLGNFIARLASSCAAFFIAASPLFAQNANLFAMLAKNGVLSEQEARQLAAEEQQGLDATSASKISLASSIRNITFYGDLRLRYELRDGSTPAGATGNGGALVTHGYSQDLNRWRYRVRVGVMGRLTDHFLFGLRLSTNPTNNRSGNVTFGHSDSAGPFGKGQSLLAVDEAYLGWHATDDITLIGGQMPNPLYTTDLVWDDNINPVGAAEKWDHVFDETWDAFATAGQFVYQSGGGNGITNTLGNGTNFSNTFMYAEQAGFRYNFDKDTFFKAAATFYTYSGTVGTSPNTSVSGLYATTPLSLAAPNQNPSYYNGPFVGAASAPTSNVSGINDLAILELPMELDFKIGHGAEKIPIRLFSDFAYNFQAGERADQARAAIQGAEAQNFVGSHGTGNSGVTLPISVPTGAGLTAADVQTNQLTFQSPTFQGALNSGKSLLDQAAYQLGVEVGDLKKKGDWDGKLYWQGTGYYALDPNLVAETFNGATNLEGVVVAISREWTDGLTSTLTYAHADPVNNKMATPTINQDLTLGDIHNYNLLQADLTWKF